MFVYLAILVAASCASWWLSGYDAKLTWHDKAADFRRRIIRSVISVLLVSVGAIGLLTPGVVGGWIWIAAAVPLGLVWSSCGAEFFAQNFHKLFDSHDHRPYDARQVQRELDRLSQLMREGKEDEALQLCKALKESPECSSVAIDTMLFRLYDQMFSDERLLAREWFSKVQRWREQRQFAEAKTFLETHLKNSLNDFAAALVLMRIYAADLHQPGFAMSLLNEMRKHKELLPDFHEYVLHRLKQWRQVHAGMEKSEEGLESLLVKNTSPKVAHNEIKTETASVDELLAAGHLSTAIEVLEKGIEADPKNFDLQLRLAEAYAINCADLRRASKLVDKIRGNPAFTPEQVQIASVKLKEWGREKG